MIKDTANCLNFTKQNTRIQGFGFVSLRKKKRDPEIQGQCGFAPSGKLSALEAGTVACFAC